MDAKQKAQKYTAAANVFNTTTVSPFTVQTSTMNYASSSVPSVTSSRPRMYESGEELNADVLDEEEEEDMEEENDEEDTDTDVEDAEVPDVDDLDDEDKDILKREDVQLDNQLLPEIPLSKFEKLAEECKKPGYQLPCKMGQKWFCQIEQGRMRRHKCKMQLPLANRGFKKCACFTAKGLVYKKIPVSVMICYFEDDLTKVL